MRKLDIPDKTCQHCGKSFRPRLHAIAKNYYCSKPCSDASKKVRIPFICQNCGSGFELIPAAVAQGKGKFCTFACCKAYWQANPKTPEQTFWSKVQKTENCWLWTGSKNKKGYGTSYFGQAHRLSWTLHKGEIPKGKMVLHHCDNPSCVNPDHLWVGTAADNTADMMNKGRHHTQKKSNNQQL